LVVVLTGANDLKRIISFFPNSNSKQQPCASVKGFRSNLMELVNDVHEISPHTKVVFPVLPTYRLDSNSIMNIFPLNFFLDALIGLWDSQKVQAAEKQWDGSVLYYGLKAADVNGWYKEERENGAMAVPSLLAADGIHPNAVCYAKWGAFVGEKLADTLVTEERNCRSRT
jgi:lysophospholipase L1-like esterase